MPKIYKGCIHHKKQIYLHLNSHKTFDKSVSCFVDRFLAIKHLIISVKATAAKLFKPDDIEL